MITTRAIQDRLAALGYNPGRADGVRGRQTIRAIKQFQLENGLAVDGIVGPVTRAKLFASGPAPAGGAVGAEGMDLRPDLPWFEQAKHLAGVHEVLGNGNNPKIMDWAQDLHIWYPGDDVAWCGLFVAHCVSSTLPDEDLPSNPLGARNWRTFGRACEPTYGCILVFWREHPTASFKGHVGFYAGEDASSFYVLGGNQSNSVNVTRLDRNRLLEARFPVTAPLGERRKVFLTPENAASETLSTNEA